MLLKPGVDIYHLCREIRRILPKIDINYPDFVITSTRHDSHGAGSLHYADRAIDIREYAFRGLKVSLDKLRKLLGKDFDIIHERTHIHIEYDPK